MEWALTFDEKGGLRSPRAFVEEVASSGVTDLFVFSHGWNNSADEAKRTNAKLFPLLRSAAHGAPGLGKVGIAGIYWPSLWFPDTPASGAQAAGDTQATAGVEDVRSGTDALTGTEIAESLALGFEDPTQQKTVAGLGQLIDETAHAARAGAPDDVLVARLEEFHAVLRSLAPPVPEFEDAGERSLLAARDPRQAYQDLAEVFGSTPAGGAQQGIGDWFDKALGGAKESLRVFSYTVMKARAGEIGKKGLGPLLAALHARTDRTRVHLIGHSFGARLVSFALAGVGAPSASPIASLLLIQGAFSHWSFAHATDNPFGENGALHACADRVHGPLVATFSQHDLALCRWYPKASFLARQDESATAAGRWGGLGEDGFQAVRPVSDRTMRAEGVQRFDFRPRTFYRVNAAAVVNDVKAQKFAGAHSDFVKPAMAGLAVSAATHT